MFKGWAILPAAQCLFGKTKVTLAEIAKEWSNGTVAVMRKPNGQLHFIAGGSGSYGRIGGTYECYHDQTGAQFGTWTMVNEVNYRRDGEDIAFTPVLPFDSTLNGTTKAAMAVFK
jgi:hypothetical protein